MAVRINEQTRVFTLHTKHSTYQMQAGRFGYLLHLYYGARVDGEEMTYNARGIDRGFSGNPYEAESDRSFSLDTLPQEYPFFGAGDYRPACLMNRNADGSMESDLKYLSYRMYRGKRAPEGLPYVYGTEEEAETLAVTLRDDVTGLQAELFYSVFEDLDIITRSAVLTNAGGEEIRLERALSVCVDFPCGPDMDEIVFYGKHSMERQPERRPVRHGRFSAGSVRGCSSHHYNPFVILCGRETTEDAGDCYGFSFVYSGNFIAETELDQANQVRFVMGLEPDTFSWKLEPGESFQTPEAMLCYSGEGLGALSRRYHRALREHVCRGKFKLARRPVLINNWEATYFGFNDDKLVQIAQDAAQIGIEMLVMDDGWFGKRDGDISGLGDWVVNETKLRGGLNSLVSRINALGLKFGIWFEPEMVSEDSDLYRTHPEWCLKTPSRKGVRSRYQFVLDMSRGDVVNYLYESMSRILNSANIEYIKWDMNRHLANVYSGALPADRQGEVYHRYVLGVYDLLERLTQTYPDVLFEGCSGGGGRFDAGMLFYTPQIWCSDNTDAIERIKIQYGTSFGYPVSAVGSHVSACPNHQTGRITPLETRGAVAMSGTFGYELDLNKMSGEEKEIMKKQVEEFKKNYDLISYGDYYRLTDPMENTVYAAWEYVSPDKKEALIDYVQLHAESNPPFVFIRAKGLDSSKRYRVLVNGTGEEIRSGAALMNSGYGMPVLTGDYRAVRVKLEEMPA